MINQINEKTNQPANLERVPKKVLDKEAFMKLFITQLQFQDPMKPLDTDQMATQLALFNQVDQLFNINDTLKKLENSFKSLDLTYATSLIGKKIKINTKIGRVENGEFLGGEFNLDNPVNNAEIVIRNSEGKVVKRIQLTNLQAGTHKINWDATDNEGNKVKDGNYMFSIIIPKGKTTTTITPTMIAKVTGAKLGDKPQIIIDEKEVVNLEDIKELFGG
ncbi:flagellar hook assembly protein FlgD [Thermodesulfobacterium hydrogeniphilum]|uniref:flagellar hook assembly protein FlgD n=1 Tax=Thermodesulfobacterium hydrogeniphilum TaxID=161156 RepID=UPI00056EFAB2|nr:FlgD immunoglobulin-like domain containing protein [Thermodesulfobacterium hydrogeniphilum]